MHVALWASALAVAHIVALLWAVWARARGRRSDRPDPEAQLPDAAPAPPADHLHQSPSATVLLSWHNLCKSVPVTPGSCRDGRPSCALLKGVSGCLRAGELQGLLGPSGAGKSTLLDLLPAPPHSSHIQPPGSPARRPVVSGLVAVQGAGILWRSHGAQQLPPIQTAPLQPPYSAAGPPAGPLSVCVIPQHDLLLPALTPMEALWFAQQLSGHKEAAQTQGTCATLLQAVGLQHCAHVQIGGELPGGHLLRGLSGGERKRLSIAISLTPHVQQGVGNPRPLVVLCDEPTSGLDCACALSIMRLLRGLAFGTALHQGQAVRHTAVLAALHQPRPAIWALLDMVSVLLAGRLAYFGPCDRLVATVTATLPLPPYNPALHGSVPEYVLDALSEPPPHGTQRADVLASAMSRRLSTHGLLWAEQSHASPGGVTEGKPVPRGVGTSQLCISVHAHGGTASPIACHMMRPGSASTHAHFNLSATLPPHIDITINASVELELISPPEQPGALKQQLARWAAAGGTACLQARLLTWREVVRLRADPVTVPLKLLLSTWSGAMLGIVLYSVGDSGGIETVQLRAAALFLACCLHMCLPFASMLAYTSDAAHVRREAEAGLYGPMPLLVSKFVTTAPLNAACALCHAMASYGLQGLRPSPVAVVQHGCLAVLLVFCSAQVMHLSVCMFSSCDAAFMLTTAWGVLNMFVSGYLIPTDALRLRWLAPLRHLSALRMCYQGMLRAELAGVGLPCGGTTLTKAAGFGFTALPALPEDCNISGDIMLRALGASGSVTSSAVGLGAYVAGLLALAAGVQVVRWPRARVGPAGA